MGSPAAPCCRQLRGCLKWQQPSDHSSQPSMKRCSPTHPSGSCHTTAKTSSQNVMLMGRKINKGHIPRNLWTTKIGHCTETEIACLCLHWNHQLYLQNIWGRHMAPPPIHTGKNKQTWHLVFCFNVCCIYFNVLVFLWSLQIKLEKDNNNKTQRLTETSYYVHHFRPTFSPEQQLIYIQLPSLRSEIPATWVAQQNQKL